MSDDAVNKVAQALKEAVDLGDGWTCCLTDTLETFVPEGERPKDYLVYAVAELLADERRRFMTLLAEIEGIANGLRFGTETGAMRLFTIWDLVKRFREQQQKPSVDSQEARRNDGP